MWKNNSRMNSLYHFLSISLNLLVYTVIMMLSMGNMLFNTAWGIPFKS